MNPRRTTLSTIAWLALSACGSGGAGGGGTAPSGTSVCFYNPLGFEILQTPAQIASLNAAIAANGQAVIGLVLGGSSIRMTITTPAPGTLAANETMIFNNIDTTVTRDKGIQARNVCSGLEVAHIKRVSIRGTISFKLTKAIGSSGFDTVELHRPDFLGIWAEIGEFSPDTFWALAAGRNVTFLWLTD